MSNKEIHGRLILWYFAINKAQDYLEVVERATNHGPNRVDPDPGSPIYPSEVDLANLCEGLRIASVVTLATIRNSGFSKDGIVAPNNEEFYHKHIDEILSELFGEEEKRRVKELFETLNKIRNEVLAHNDGNEMHNIKSDGGSYITAPWQLMNKLIDFAYLGKVLPTLGRQIILQSKRFELEE